ncbi:putative OTU domain-containing protein-like isoform X2 [Capsicum annuum]|uniref:Uncharacterized protein n=1 Tax=Capsicum annuum TaxID=4072 RepID=A0A2G2Y8R3_CAPAN|nr:putative OTU domain-containing protein-like isoform X2 [Capsicum annuum]KAF3662468.1 putative OTU domain-containing protein-like isoform X2 [Capsicum annuum]PHT65941.1 hypothetical protein T459_30366 [Capsicum annuum]
MLPGRGRSEKAVGYASWKGNLYTSMTVYEPDPDVVRWNLHLIDVCGINNGGSLGTVTHYDKDFSHLGYVQEGYSEPTHVNVENDEIIAHALQEELSRLSLEESLGSSHTDEEHRKTSVLAQDWVAPSRGNYNFLLDGNEEDTDSNGKITFCPSTVTSSNWEHQAISPERENESLLDGEVGKRLNQLAAIPVIRSSELMCLRDTPVPSKGKGVYLVFDRVKVSI